MEIEMFFCRYDIDGDFKVILTQSNIFTSILKEIFNSWIKCTVFMLSILEYRSNWTKD